MNLAQGIRSAIARLISSPVPDRQTIEEVIRGIQRALLLADVRADLVKSFSDNIRERTFNVELPRGISRRDHILKIVYDELVRLLGGERKELRVSRTPFVIMMVGIQGTGKTTSTAKLANYFAKSGYRVGVVVVDVYRPAALHQARQLLEGRGIFVYGEEDGQDPVQIAKRGLKYMSEQKVDVVIVDTAGRHKEQQGLMLEMNELYEAIRPDSVGLIVDATIGQQAGQQAEAFHRVSPVGWIMLTKMDTSARGGGALAAVNVTGAPILFIGTGEKIEDLERFDPKSYVSRLLGLPDLESIVERVRLAEVRVSEEEVKSLMMGKFTIEDLIKQLREVRKMGKLEKILEMLPIPKPAAVKQFDQRAFEDQLKRWEAIVFSMTKEERADPSLIDSSRVRRIARGAGVSEKDVKVLLKQYQDAKKAMKSIKRLQHRFAVGSVGGRS
ncbi:MAG: signal recognition particle receptor subunit alpha [Aigarchaeota archaeon]|nr:signal recognition particle receptor subunit alpha [Aigarchaeota archaeon]MDW8092663.1 signal recognition particle receptor subunit alpha [Nitrososphaerota archaeon]